MNKRVHEIAKERGVSSRAVLDRLRAAGIEVKAASSSVDEELALRVLDGGTQDGAPDSAAAAPPDRATADGRDVSPPHNADQPSRAQDASTTVPSAAVAGEPSAQGPRPQAKRPTRDSLQGER